MAIEEELEGLSFPEAPKIVVKPPGPKSLELLNAQRELETKSLIYPKAFRFAIDAAKGGPLLGMLMVITTLIGWLVLPCSMLVITTRM